MSEHPRVNTPFQTASIAELLRLELLARKLDPHQDMAALLLAQISFETNSGQSCQNHNVGNVSARDGGSVAFYRPPWFTVDASSSTKLKALNAAMLKGKAPRAFQHFETFGEGIARFLTVATQLGVVEAARTGDAEIMAAVIAKAYTPDAPSSLARTLENFRRDYQARGLFSPLPLDRAPEGAGGSDWRSRYS